MNKEAISNKFKYVWNFLLNDKLFFLLLPFGIIGSLNNLFNTNLPATFSTYIDVLVLQCSFNFLISLDMSTQKKDLND